MDKRLAAALVIIVLLAIAGGGYLVAKNRPASTSQATSSMDMSTNGSSSNSGSETPTATDKVSIKNLAFTPANITITKGTTVTWTNNDAIAHTVTETDGKDGPNSGDINPGSTYTFTFSQPGTYKYHCSIHPEMIGSVTVTE